MGETKRKEVEMEPEYFDNVCQTVLWIIIGGLAWFLLALISEKTGRIGKWILAITTVVIGFIATVVLPEEYIARTFAWMLVLLIIIVLAPKAIGLLLLSVGLIMGALCLIGIVLGTLLAPLILSENESLAVWGIFFTLLIILGAMAVFVKLLKSVSRGLSKKK